VARKIAGLQRVLDAPALFSVAYGEIAASIYVALGIIALHALGLTPVVLALVGALFLVVSLSYAEGTTAIPETGGAATFVRRAFNDLAGFLTGWALFLDYLIVIALSALFMPHYLSGALKVKALSNEPWDVVVAICAIVVIAAFRLVRRSAFYRYGIVVAVLDLITQVGLVALGFAFLFSGDALTRGLSIGTSPSWHEIAFALPLAMLAYTGLETVANLARGFGRLNRGTFVSPEAILAAAVVSIPPLVDNALLADEVTFLASLFSFGVLLAFTAAQLAVIKLRFSEPGLARPYRAPGGIRIRGVEVPLPALIGSVATFGIFVAAMATHAGARYGGPNWLVAGLVVYGVVRHTRGAGLLEHVQAPSEHLPETQYSSILVPMKVGLIGEEMIATAVKLAQERA